MSWNFELIAGLSIKGRTGGLVWDGKGMLFSGTALRPRA